MFRTLIVPLDGSDLAEWALQYAAPLAMAEKARIVLVRVALTAPLVGVDGLGWEYDQGQALRDAQEYLSAVAEGLGDQFPIETVVTFGRPVEEILEQVRQFHADAIVMATHGRTGLAHLLHGSVPEAVLASSPVPVFLVHARSGAPPIATFDPLASRLLVPLDGSPFAETAVELAFDFLGPTGEVVLVTVVQPPDHVLRDDRGRAVAYLDQQGESRTSKGRGYLEDVARRLHARHPSVRFSLDVRMDAPVAGIIAAAAEHATDLVVMATHGRTGLSRNTVGSVAGDVLRDGSTPLLLIRPAQVVQTKPQPTPRALLREEVVRV